MYISLSFYKEYSPQKWSIIQLTRPKVGWRNTHTKCKTSVKIRPHFARSTNWNGEAIKQTVSTEQMRTMTVCSLLILHTQNDIITFSNLWTYLMNMKNINRVLFSQTTSVLKHFTWIFLLLNLVFAAFTILQPF